MYKLCLVVVAAVHQKYITSSQRGGAFAPPLPPLNPPLTKYGQHFATFDVATGDASYTLGVRHVFSGSAQDTLDTLKEILEDLDMVQKQIGGAKVSSKIVSKFKNTMSDCHAAEKLFN